MLDAALHINWPAVIVAALAYFVLGALWFTPLFGRAWDASMGHTRQPGQRFGPLYYIAPLITAFLVAVATAILRAATGVHTYGDAVVLGIVLGVGYSAAVSLTNAVIPTTPRPLLFAAVAGSYHVVGAVLVCVILVAWI